MKNQKYITQVLKTKKELKVIDTNLLKIVKYKKNYPMPYFTRKNDRKQASNSPFLPCFNYISFNDKGVTGKKKSATPEPKFDFFSSHRSLNTSGSNKSKKVYKTSEKTIVIF
jgi:hypothetical protein